MDKQETEQLAQYIIYLLHSDMRIVEHYPIYKGYTSPRTDRYTFLDTKFAKQNSRYYAQNARPNSYAMRDAFNIFSIAHEF